MARPLEDVKCVCIRHTATLPPSVPSYKGAIAQYHHTISAVLSHSFWENAFTNFSFEKLLSHEALVTGRVTATSNNLKKICVFFQSVFLIEMFDFRGKELKHAKELLLNHYRQPYKYL